MRSSAQSLAALLLAGPVAIVLAVFIVVPLLLIVFISFQSPSPVGLWQQGWSVGSYARAFTDTFYLGILGDSVRIAFVTTVLCILIGYPLAYHLARSAGVKRGVCMFLVLCPLLVSTVIRSFGWVVILGSSGVINSIFEALGIGSRNLIYSEPAVVVGLTHFLVPFMTLPLMASIERIPVSVEEAARNLGARGLGVFRLVILPLSVPGLIAGCVLVFTLAISAVVTPLFLGGRKVQMIGTQIYNNVTVTFNWPFAGALTVIAILITAAAIAVSAQLIGRSNKQNVRRSVAYT
jgi:ABC-type spermidine/putrescine transport system permease subunit I